MFLDVHELYARKQYMTCILNIAQAYEAFFSLYLRVEILFKPFAVDQNKLNNLLDTLSKSRYTFDPLCAIFLQMVVDDASPRNLTEAATALSDLSAKPSKPKRDALNSVKDSKLREHLKAIYDTKIHVTRNRVVHDRAYRPTREEVEMAYTEASETLCALTERLNLCDDIEYYNKT
jgi:hypothetical protein